MGGGGPDKQYRRLAIGYQAGIGQLLLNIGAGNRMTMRMKTLFTLPAAALALALAAAPAGATCYAEYKAKQDNPLKLHYGVMELGPACPPRGDAKAQVAARLQRGGWVLLNVISLFEGTPSKAQQQNAGSNFLRY